jgi:hypothetical protein
MESMPGNPKAQVERIVAERGRYENKSHNS